MENPAAKLFRERIRQLREDRGWTQEQAAEHCGVGYKLYQLYEQGRKDNPGLRSLEKIAAGFGLKIHELLDPSGRRTAKTFNSIGESGAHSRT